MKIKLWIGGILTYGLFLFLIPYYLYVNNYTALFLLYFANVDILMNIMAINFPLYFKPFYNIRPKGLYEILSFNMVNMIALSGILIRGISLKNERGADANDLRILITILLIAVMTWFLPTETVPWLMNHVHTVNRFEKIVITTLISVSFIVVEGLMIHYWLDQSPLFRERYRFTMLD